MDSLIPSLEPEPRARARLAWKPWDSASQKRSSLESVCCPALSGCVLSSCAAVQGPLSHLPTSTRLAARGQTRTSCHSFLLATPGGLQTSPVSLTQML